MNRNFENKTTGNKNNHREAPGFTPPEKHETYETPEKKTGKEWDPSSGHSGKEVSPVPEQTGQEVKPTEHQTGPERKPLTHQTGEEYEGGSSPEKAA